MEVPLLPLFALSFSISVFLGLAAADFLSLKDHSTSSPFPTNFLFGTASSSYQIEGAYLSDGKGLNNWDVFTHKPGTVTDGSNGDVADDHYHRYKEDVDLMDYIGVNSYRFSLSWARILPKGRFGKVNRAGIDYYNRLIDTLLSRGIEPFVTISHYDIPQELVDRYDGWLSPKIAFEWQKIQGGKIGLAVHTMWFEPISNSFEDKIAAERAQAFYMNCYPREMREILGEDLPPVPYELEKLKPSIDFIGVNHYTSYFVKDCIHSVCEPGGLGPTRTEGSALTWAHINGMTIGKPTSLEWLFIYPEGLEKIVTYIKERYNNLPIYLTENGVGWKENANMTKEMINDVDRIDYLRAYLDSLTTAIRKGADVRGYFLWSLLDNFEWTDGSSIRFGLHRVDYDTLERTPRMSASWYKNFIALHASGPGTKPRHTQE
ncbi:hypothetical protein VNO80_29058 [Phaseolus coccineus]|uniref:Beta-glucosidase n=1 Tax=Phaseolus coccineus TaxID=3886 RepID=A0AAN9LDN6_PHACN